MLPLRVLSAGYVVQSHCSEHQRRLWLDTPGGSRIAHTLPLRLAGMLAALCSSLPGRWKRNVSNGHTVLSATRLPLKGATLQVDVRVLCRKVAAALMLYRLQLA